MKDPTQWNFNRNRQPTHYFNWGHLSKYSYQFWHNDPVPSLVWWNWCIVPTFWIEVFSNFLNSILNHNTASLCSNYEAISDCICFFFWNNSLLWGYYLQQILLEVTFRSRVIKLTSPLFCFFWAGIKWIAIRASRETPWA